EGWLKNTGDVALTHRNNGSICSGVFTNLSNIGIQHANFSHSTIDHVHLFGTEFRNVVLPQETDGNYDPEGNYKPVSFHKCDLNKTRFSHSNLSHVEITDCDITGLKINGILIEDLLKNITVR
ncbi:pentapeptide repeat-containing protein, partial [Paenibacillaceae bacterium]